MSRVAVLLLTLQSIQVHSLNGAESHFLRSVTCPFSSSQLQVFICLLPSSDPWKLCPKCKAV